MIQPSIFFDVFAVVHLLGVLVMFGLFSASIWSSFKRPFYKILGTQPYFKILQKNIAGKMVVLLLGYLLYYMCIFFSTSPDNVAVIMETQVRIFVGVLNLILYFVVYYWSDLVSNNHEQLTEMEDNVLIEKVIAWNPPPLSLIEANMKPTNVCNE